MDSKTARAFHVRVESLIGSAAAGEEPDPATRTWLCSISPVLSERLAKRGLTKAGAMTTGLEAFANRFIASRKDTVAYSTNKHSEESRDKAVQFFGKNRDIRSISLADGIAFSNWLRTKTGGNVGENTARKRCATMRCMFQYAVDSEIIATNIWASRKIPKRVGAAAADKRHHLNPADSEKVLTACLGMQDKELGVLFALCRYAGVRVGEAFLVEWGHVDFERLRLTVISPKTKKTGHGQRVVPLFPELERVLTALHLTAPEGIDNILPSYSSKTQQWAKKRIEAAARRAGVDKWPRCFQSLRTTRATELADHLPGHVCAAFLGHTEAVANESYRRPNETHYAAAAALETASLYGGPKTEKDAVEALGALTPEARARVLDALQKAA